MTDQEAPTSEVPATPPVLGVDPPAPKPAPTTPIPAPATIQPDPIVESGLQVSQEEYDSLLEKASGYDSIVKDPGLQAQIYDYLKQQAIQQGAPVPVEPSTQPGQPGGDPTDVTARLSRLENTLMQGAQAFQQLQQENAGLKGEVATLRTDRFAEANPDFKTHEPQIAAVLKKHPTMSLQEAYSFVTARALGAGNGSVSERPVAPTTEGGGAGDLPSAYGGDVDAARMAEVAARVNDPKATPTLDSALDAIEGMFFNQS